MVGIMLTETKRSTVVNVSIVVPVFNAESTIKATLNSLLKQTISNFEIICVNDGSTDSSAQILSDFETQHPDTLRVISTSNQGVYNARATGIKTAKGKYIGFCDADDTVDPSMFETLFSNIEKFKGDIAVCAYHRKEKGRTLSTEMAHPELSYCETNAGCGWLASINTSLWNKLFRSKIIKKHITLSQPPRITEDAIFLLSIYPYTKRIVFVDQPLYNYYVNNNSAMKSISKEDIISIIRSWKELRGAIEPSYITLIDLAAFIHLGLSIPVIMLKSKYSDFHRYIKKIRNILAKDFTFYSHNPFFSCSYVFKHRRWMTLPFLASLLHRLHLLPFSLKIYVSLTKILRKDLKW